MYILLYEIGGETMELTTSEWLFYGGLAVMAIAFMMALLCITVFFFTGRELKKKLEQEYGKER